MPKKNLSNHAIAKLAHKLCRNRIGQIIFDGYELSYEQLSNFVDIVQDNLSGNRQIKLKFINTPLSAAQVELLSNLFDKMGALHFINADLDDEAINVIANYLQYQGCKLTTLHLERNLLTEHAYEILLEGLLENNSINQLFLNETHNFETGNYERSYELLDQYLQQTSRLSLLGLKELRHPLSGLRSLINGVASNESLQKLTLGKKNYSLCGDLTEQLCEAIGIQGRIILLENKDIDIPKASSAIVTRVISDLNKTVKLNRDKINMFFDAIYQGNYTAVVRTLRMGKISIFSKGSKTGFSALHVAALARSHSAKIIDKLYEYGYKTLVRHRSTQGEGSTTALHLAVTQSNLLGAQALLRVNPAIAKSTLQMKDARNKTAIELANEILDNSEGDTEDLQKIITTLTMATRRTNDRVGFFDRVIHDRDSNHDERPSILRRLRYLSA